MMNSGRIFRQGSAFLLASALCMVAPIVADDSALTEYEAGKRFGEISVRFLIELTKKNMSGAAAIEKEKEVFRRDPQIDWLQGMYDGFVKQDIQVLAEEAGLDQQGIAHAYVFYFSMKYGLEQGLKALRGEAVIESDGEAFYASAAQAVYNDSSEEKIEELKESFYYLSIELQELAGAQAVG